MLKIESFSLRYGAKVQFKLKGAGYIAGTFVRLKRKNAEVLSSYGRHGLRCPYPVRWTVSPELLIPLTTEQVKLFEFP